MSDTTAAAFEREVALPVSMRALGEALALTQSAALWLDGRGDFEQTWITGSMLALEPRVSMIFPGPELRTPDRALERLEGIVSRRRCRKGSPATGVALLLAYEALDDDRAIHAGAATVPRMVVLEVDRTLREIEPGRYVLAGLRGRHDARDRSFDRWVDRQATFDRHRVEPARVCGSVESTLPREKYLRSVRRVKRHIESGDVYQANLCQHFTAPYRGDESRLFLELLDAMPAPRSAFVRTPGFSLASVSPETFLRADPDGRVETWPIKGTRSRAVGAVADLEAAKELIDSPKDRAELLMIVDLERNDLGRVCQVGSISVRQLAALQSFSAVHHLVACVEGRLRTDVGVSELFRSTFPGGSITGAPKKRARQILREIEGGPRGFFTGSLCWLGDDGSLDSSILIRTIVFAQGQVRVGAGGGIVADSDPEQEWRESVLKARGPATALGFCPEETR